MITPPDTSPTGDQITYDSLVFEVTNYLNRTDPNLVNTVPNFILLAQKVIDRSYLGLYSEVYATFNFLIGNNTINKPIDWLATQSFSIIADEKYYEVLERPKEYVDRMARVERGNPEVFSDYAADNWIVAPTPIAATSAMICYCAAQPILSKQNQTNWCTIKSPDVIFHAVMWKASEFVQDIPKATYYEQLFIKSLQSLQSLNKRVKITRQNNVYA